MITLLQVLGWLFALLGAIYFALVLAFFVTRPKPDDSRTRMLRELYRDHDAMTAKSKRRAF